jgi:tetratricopeptide (TPR) repeat protein
LKSGRSSCIVVFPVTRKKLVLLIFGGIALFNIVYGIAVMMRGRHDTLDPHLAGETMALDHLSDAHHLFYTPASHADLAAARADLVVSASDEKTYAVGVQSPAAFRALDHERQFDGLLFTGDSTTYKPLLNELAQAKDFTLTWLDNATLVFRRRGATAWKEADLDATATRFTGENHARFMAGASRQLVAIGQLAMAKRALDAAAPNGKGLTDYWTALALYDGEVAHWADALDAVKRALAIAPDDTGALTTEAQILFGSRRFDEAMTISDRVIEAHPDDPSMLFLHAMISHQAHSYDREIAALTHLMDLAQAQGQSVTGYRIYLGQAYAEHGDGMLSLIQFQKAVESPDISPAQKKFAMDCIGKIRDHATAPADGVVSGSLPISEAH